MMVIEKPAIMDAIAARSVNLVQNSERIIIGQNVAAIPDQPKITNQNIVRSGESNGYGDRQAERQYRHEQG